MLLPLDAGIYIRIFRLGFLFPYGNALTCIIRFAVAFRLLG